MTNKEKKKRKRDAYFGMKTGEKKNELNRGGGGAQALESSR